jgi:hypothetical protein
MINQEQIKELKQSFHRKPSWKSEIYPTSRNGKCYLYLSPLREEEKKY